MTVANASDSDLEILEGHRDRNRVIIVADDYQFLDTIHSTGPAVAHEWLVANSRERLIELTEPPPYAFIVDLAARSIESAEALYLLGALSISSKVVLLSNDDPDKLANALAIGSKMSLAIAGTLPRPLLMDALLRVLASHTQAQVAISADELRSALGLQQFVLHYQPIIMRAGSGWQPRATEALIRWEHPRHGLLYPSQFLNVIKAARLMTALTDFVMSDAAQQAGRWQGQGLDVGVAVNLAPRLVRDAGFADRLLRLLRQFELSPSGFTLEVIESDSVRDRELVADAMGRVRSHGIGLSLDDFGVGHSSLMELYRLPFSEIKIDRSLIHDVTRSAKAATIVTGIIELAHRLSIRVCAEGVETPETFAFLSAANCDAMQGVFIAKPTTPANIERLVRTWEPEKIGQAVAHAISGAHDQTSAARAPR